MKCKCQILCVLFITALLHTSITIAWAKAPATPKILFTSTRDGNYEVYTMNPNGTEQVNLTHHRAADLDARWSPTGEQILFVSDRDGVRDLYFIDPDGSHVRRVFGKSTYRHDPTWSPDGKQIAYSRRELGQRFIYIATLKTKKEERITPGGLPDWSPDGREIAFNTAAKDHMQINILNVETGRQKIFWQRGVVPSWTRSPAWSPTGDKIAFSWNKRMPAKAFKEKETIYVANRDGTDLEQVVAEGSRRANDPVWSPQGDALLYYRRTGDNWAHIFKIVLGSDTPEQLTHHNIAAARFKANYAYDWFDPAYALPVSPKPNLLTTTWGEVKRQ
ncbi:MAG: hypothetical protein OXU36_15705 [Candidatus Poribacteria bacterium]|nr:hypothetical protein [Candidatus Poribacteria bacterium]